MNAATLGKQATGNSENSNNNEDNGLHKENYRGEEQIIAVHQLNGLEWGTKEGGRLFSYRLPETFPRENVCFCLVKKPVDHMNKVEERKNFILCFLRKNDSSKAFGKRKPEEDSFHPDNACKKVLTYVPADMAIERFGNGSLIDFLETHLRNVGESRRLTFKNSEKDPDHIAAFELT